MLNKIDFDTENVQYVESTIEGVVNIVTNKSVLYINVEVDGRTTKIQQHHRRWDWILSTCKQLDDQPIVIRCEDNSLRLSVDY